MQALSQLSYGPTKGRELWGTAPLEVKPAPRGRGSSRPPPGRSENHFTGFRLTPGYSADGRGAPGARNSSPFLKK